MAAQVRLECYERRRIFHPGASSPGSGFFEVPSNRPVREEVASLVTIVLFRLITHFAHHQLRRGPNRTDDEHRSYLRNPGTHQSTVWPGWMDDEYNMANLSHFHILLGEILSD